MMIPSSSHMPPIDGRVTVIEMAAWPLLVWAYREQCVLAATNRVGPQRQRSAAQAVVDHGEGREFTGTVSGELEAHEDAFAVDAFVAAWLHDASKARGADALYVRIARACGSGVPVAKSLGLPEPEWVPKLNASGAVMWLYDENRHRAGVKMHWKDGFSPEDRAWQEEGHRVYWRVFMKLLAGMDGKRFGARRVCGLGLTDCAIWLTPNQRSALRQSGQRPG